MNFLNLKIDGTTDSNNKSRIQKNLLNIIEVAIFGVKICLEIAIHLKL